MDVTGTFRFHNVGQGLFYSGKIVGPDGSEFNFVYDCGALSKGTSLKSNIESNIEQYKKSLPDFKEKKILDLLIISHFHDDHVNGFVNLLDGNVEVRMAIIPYYTEQLRQVICLESTDPTLDDFNNDPVNWLLEHGVINLLLLGANDGGNNSNLNREGPAITMDMENISGLNPSGGTTDIPENSLAIYYKQGSHVLWQFYFENLKLKAPQKVDEYITMLKSALKGKPLTDFIQNGVLINPLPSEVRKIFKSGSLINRTSVMVLHGPESFISCSAQCACRCLHENYTKCPINNNKANCACFVGSFFPVKCHGITFLTGDIELYLHSRVKLLNILGTIDCPHRCFVLQYPHHGAPTKALPRFVSLNARFNVISYGTKNSYGHPSKRGFFTLPNNLVCVHEENAFEYTINVMM